MVIDSGLFLYFMVPERQMREPTQILYIIFADLEKEMGSKIFPLPQACTYGYMNTNTHALNGLIMNIDMQAYLIILLWNAGMELIPGFCRAGSVLSTILQPLKYQTPIISNTIH